MNKCIFFALITSKRPDHGRSDLLRLILSFTSLLKFKIARDISYIHTVESTQILFVAKEMLFCGEMAILRTLCRTCGARARVRINVQMDCHMRMCMGVCMVQVARLLVLVPARGTTYCACAARRACTDPIEPPRSL